MADSRLKIDIRRKSILERLRRDGRVTVTELASAFGVTPVTIRCDLDSLEKDGYLERINGGAIYSPDTGRGDSQRESIERYESKLAIAGQVAAQVKDGNTLFINSGSTAMLIASELKCRYALNVVTNSLAVASALADAHSFHVIVLGGELNAKYGFTYGAAAEDMLRNYHADFAILSVDGVSATGGITTYHAEESGIDRMMIRGADRVLIAADYTKIGKAGFMRVCDFTESITLFTNREASPEELQALSLCGVGLTLC